MAMRLFNKRDFQAELRRAGLEPTSITTTTGRLWKTKDGLFISVPEIEDTYPDSILEAVLRQVGLLYKNKNSS